MSSGHQNVAYAVSSADGADTTMTQKDAEFSFEPKSTPDYLDVAPRKGKPCCNKRRVICLLLLVLLLLIAIGAAIGIAIWQTQTGGSVSSASSQVSLLLSGVSQIPQSYTNESAPMSVFFGQTLLLTLSNYAAWPSANVTTIQLECLQTNTSISINATLLLPTTLFMVIPLNNSGNGLYYLTLPDFYAWVNISQISQPQVNATLMAIQEIVGLITTSAFANYLNTTVNTTVNPWLTSVWHNVSRWVPANSNFTTAEASQLATTLLLGHVNVTSLNASLWSIVYGSAGSRRRAPAPPADCGIQYGPAYAQQQLGLNLLRHGALTVEAIGAIIVAANVPIHPLINLGIYVGGFVMLFDALQGLRADVECATQILGADIDHIVCTQNGRRRDADITCTEEITLSVMAFGHSVDYNSPPSTLANAVSQLMSVRQRLQQAQQILASVFSSSTSQVFPDTSGITENPPVGPVNQPVPWTDPALTASTSVPCCTITSRGVLNCDPAALPCPSGSFSLSTTINYDFESPLKTTLDYSVRDCGLVPGQYVVFRSTWNDCGNGALWRTYVYIDVVQACTSTSDANCISGIHYLQYDCQANICEFSCSSVKLAGSFTQDGTLYLNVAVLNMTTGGCGSCGNDYCDEVLNPYNNGDSFSFPYPDTSNPVGFDGPSTW